MENKYLFGGDDLKREHSQLVLWGQNNLDPKTDKDIIGKEKANFPHEFRCKNLKHY